MTCIHLIDDDDALRASLVALLAGQPGWRVVEWSSGDRFLAESRALAPGVLLLDYNMPGTNGLDVLHALDGDARFAVVMMTGSADVRLAVTAMRKGAVHFVEKPCDPEAVTAAVAEARDTLEANKPAVTAKARIARLAPRERDVLNGLVAGLQNKSIARVLGISPRTVEIYRSTLMDKLGAQSLSAAIHLAFIAGIFPEEEPEPWALAA